MPITESKYIWMDGSLVPWKDASVHVLSHGLHYGSGVFEGIRAYETPTGPAIFRLSEHIHRLFASAKIIMMEIPYEPVDLIDACKAVVRENGLSSCYLRPIAFCGYGEMGLNPLTSSIQVAIGAWPWGSYLGEEGLTSGIRAKISSWQRHDPNSVPPAAKLTGMYINSALAKMEAVKAGYDEAIILSPQGYVSECTGENLFVVKNGTLITPPNAAGALAGITRSTIESFAADMGVPVSHENLIRSDLYLADEIFITGTAAEVVPVAEVDDRTVADGRPGPITKELQSRYFSVVSGKDDQYREWLEYVAK
ncbi:MAG: branched-chain amino acid transaminase [Ferrimicrobium sp.]